MIKTKLGQLVNTEPVLGKLDAMSKADGEEKLSFRLTYKLAKMIKKVQPELQDFYEQRAKILKKTAVEVTENKKDETTGEDIAAPTGQWTITDQEGFKKYFEQLVNIDIELDGISGFTLEELEEVKGLTTDDIFMLEPLIQESKSDIKETRTKIEIDLDN